MKAFFFDMDGVIFDSMPHHAEAWEIVMKRYGLTFSVRDCYVNEGRTGWDVINICYYHKYGTLPPQELVKQIYDEKSNKFSSYGEALPMKGIEEVLHYLQDKQIWIVTGSGQRTLFSKLEEHFPNIFSPSRMVTAFDVEHGKPNPEPYLKAWERSGLTKDECCVIENAPLGIRAAKQAGLFCIAVNTGPLTRADLYEENADIVLNDMKELLQWLQINDFIDKNILPLYDTFDAAHKRSHALYVMQQSLRLCAEHQDANPLMSYVIAAYHDIGLQIDREQHHIHSGRFIRQDARLKQWFSEQQIETMAQAAEDHRASSKTPPRTIYGAIVASADRNLSPENIIRRTLQFSLSHYPEYTKEEHFERAIKHITEKYGEGGYLHLVLYSEHNEQGLRQIRQLLLNRQQLFSALNNSWNTLSQNKNQ